MNDKKLEGIGFLRLKEVLEFIPISKTRWYDGIRDGIYPKPIKLVKNGRTSLWSKGAIRSLIRKLESGDI